MYFHKLICLCFILFFSACSDKSEERDVTKESGYVGKEFSLQRPAVFIENLPHIKNISSDIWRNSFALLAEESSKEIRSFLNKCHNCIGPGRLVRPLRVVNIPSGEKFTVVKEFIYFSSGSQVKGDINIHSFLLKGDDGEISEISKLSFEGLFIPNNHGIIEYEEINWTLGIIYSFNSKKVVSLTYCPSLDIAKNQDISKFIDDFELEDEVEVLTNSDSCDGGFVLKFHNPESFLTAKNYFSEWGLYGKWIQ